MPLKGDQDKTVVSTIASLFGLYAIFVFISGWTFFDSYYSAFGLYARWLNLSPIDVLTKGFIILFEPHGSAVWLIYIFVLVVPVLFEIIPDLRARPFTQLVVACLLLACLPLTYFVSRRAALAAAASNQGTSTNLPYIRFATGCGLFSGRLLFVKDHDFYIHDLTTDKGKSVDACLTLSPKANGNRFLYLFRFEDVHEVEILEQPTGG
jgi:hypothetical protein